MLPKTKLLAKSFLDELESVVPMKEQTSSVFDLKAVQGPFKHAFGEHGHSFIYGYFAINEQGEFVYRNQNFEEYKRIILTSREV